MMIIGIGKIIFTISNVDLYERGMPDGVVQVDGGSFSWEEDGDGLNNDAVARAAFEYYLVENVTIELERYVQGVWVDAGNATTDEEGIAVILIELMVNIDGLHITKMKRWTKAGL